jgi:glycosyltransferase involved in cell wall biosynthesis
MEPTTLEHARSGGSKGTKHRVLLVRDVPEERRLSMERFADELAASVAATRTDYEIRHFARHESQLAARVGLRRMDSYAIRFARYPIGVRRERADVYHVIDQGYAHAAALIPHERTIVTCHDLMLLLGERALGPGVHGTPTSVIRFRWTTSFLKKVAWVACDSRSTADDAVRLCGVNERRVRVIHPGVGAHFRRLADAPRTLAPGHAYTVLHVASGMPYKNVDTTLEVVAALRRAGIDAALVRVGAPLSSSEQRRAKELGLDGAIVECGRVADERLVEIYNNADVLLFPSHYEGFGWPPLEAMACGTPVVCSNTASLPEVVGDAALTAAPNDVHGLASAVHSILTSRVVADSMRARGLARAAGYTWKRTANAYAELYDDVVQCAEERSLRNLRGRAKHIVRNQEGVPIAVGTRGGK